MTLYLLKCELCEKEIMLDIWTTYDLHCPICERGLLHYSGMKAGARSFRELLEDRDESELIEANLKEITAKLESAPSISRTLLNKNDMLKDIVKHAPAIAESLKNAPTTPAPTITPPGRARAS